MGLELLFQGSNIERLLNGLWVTAEIAFVSVFFACILGVIFGVIMTSRNPIIKAICRFYLEFVRIIPLLALLFLAYFGLAKWFDIHLDGISVCILVFIFWGTAEMGDLVRGALTSIEKHQVESAYALGLTPFQTFVYILLPQSLKRVTPSAINLFTRMVKTSSLAMLIGVVPNAERTINTIPAARKYNPITNTKYLLKTSFIPISYLSYIIVLFFIL